MTKPLLFFLGSSLMGQQITHLLPAEIWTQILEQLPGNQLFLHQMLYLKKQETGAACIKMNQVMAHNIVKACELKIEEVLFRGHNARWLWRDSFWVLQFPETIECYDQHEVHARLSPCIAKLSLMYHSAPDENKQLLHDLIWKRVLEQSYEQRMNDYPGLECRRPIDYARVTTATIRLSKQIQERWSRERYTSYRISKLDTIGKCAIALLIIIDDKKLINKAEYGQQLMQLLPGLQIMEK